MRRIRVRGKDRKRRREGEGRGGGSKREKQTENRRDETSIERGVPNTKEKELCENVIRREKRLENEREGRRWIYIYTYI